MEIRSLSIDVQLLPNNRASAIAAYEVIGLQDMLAGASFLGHGDAHPVVILLDDLRRPSESGRHIGHFGQSRAKHLFSQVLR